MEEIKKITFDVIEKLKENQIQASDWDKIKKFIDIQFMIEKDKSTLNYDKNALVSLINGQIW